MKIASWKEFLAAVERMRECQTIYFQTGSSSALHVAKKHEAAVDACIKEKRAEWARQLQTEEAKT